MMKSENAIIGALAATAVLLSAFLAFNPRSSNSASADVLDSGGGIKLLTSSTGFGNGNMLDVLDSRDGILLVYTPNGNRLKLVSGDNLSRIMNVPALH